MKPHMRLASFQCETRHPSLDFVGQFETPVWAQYAGMPHSASARDALVIDLLPSDDLYELYSKVLTNLHDRGDLVVFKQDLRFPPLQLFPNTDIAGRQHLRNVLGTQGRLRQLNNGAQTLISITDPETNTIIDRFTGGYIELWHIDGTAMTRRHKWELAPERSWRLRMPAFRRQPSNI